MRVTGIALQPLTITSQSTLLLLKQIQQLPHSPRRRPLYDVRHEGHRPDLAQLAQQVTIRAPHPRKARNDHVRQDNTCLCQQLR